MQLNAKTAQRGGVRDKREGVTFEGEYPKFVV